jgi:hypothetical protein
MTNNLKTLRNCAMALALCAGFAACSDDDDFDVTINVANAGFQYDANGVWADVYTNNAVAVDGFNFSHTGGGTEYDGVTYYSWAGFCPSKCSDTTDYSSTTFVSNHEWNSITGAGVTGSEYMVGFWSSSETAATPNEAGTYITYGTNGTFKPSEVYVTNNTYAYYTMLNGNSFSTQFTDDSWFILTIHGSLNNVETGSVNVALANGTDILKNWTRVNLSPLGTVDRIYFTMTSSDTGQWGMNTPGYFCLDRLSINLD